MLLGFADIRFDDFLIPGNLVENASIAKLPLTGQYKNEIAPHRIWGT
jgi:hypothetical protein